MHDRTAVVREVRPAGAELAGFPVDRDDPQLLARRIGRAGLGGERRGSAESAYRTHDAEDKDTTKHENPLDRKKTGKKVIESG
jgi:hypothetical protein